MLGAVKVWSSQCSLLGFACAAPRYSGPPLTAPTRRACWWLSGRRAPREFRHASGGSNKGRSVQRLPFERCAERRTCQASG